MPASGHSGPLQPDRPGQAQPAFVLPKRTGQIELGGTFGRETHGENVTAWSAPQPLLRLGVLERAELRLSAPGWIGSHEGGETQNAGSDLALSTKLRLLESRGWLPATSVLAGLSLPTGGRAATSDGYDPFGALLESWELPRGFSLDANFALAAPSRGVDDSGRFYQLGAAASLGIPLTDDLSAFLEPYAIFRGEGEPDEYAVDAGVSYLLSGDLALDLSVGAGLDRTAPDLFIGAGIAWRFWSPGLAEGTASHRERP